jgi:diadenosine tetraphosphate (Ap4A) HIT family hydrolase
VSSESSCPFCDPDPDLVFFESELVVGLWDRYPVSPGHALLIPRKHVADWFDADPATQLALISALPMAREAIASHHSPDGFNIGINAGKAAGQTIFHLHVHLIPRYNGDQEDPRGGVRHVMPDKAKYWDDPE